MKKMSIIPVLACLIFALSTQAWASDDYEIDEEHGYERSEDTAGMFASTYLGDFYPDGAATRFIPKAFLF